MNCIGYAGSPKRQSADENRGLVDARVGLGRVELPTSRVSGQLRWRSPTLTDVFEHEMRIQRSPVSASIGQCCYSL